jgi:hypothetical protein
MATSKDVEHPTLKKTKEITDNKNITKPRAGYARVVSCKYVGAGSNRHKAYEKADFTIKHKDNWNQVIPAYMRKANKTQQEYKQTGVQPAGIVEVIFPDNFKIPDEWKTYLDEKA